MDLFRQLWTQFQAYWAGLGRARRVAMVAMTLFIAVALGGVAYFSSGQQFRPLFSELSPEDAAAMKTILTTQNIPNQLSSDGTSLLVPENRFAEAKVAVGAAGLPTRGGKGYELFDESSLTMTPFVQSVNYQRALQSELSRSITQIESIQSARVLIARPDPSPFIRDSKPTTASVVVKLRPGAVLSRASAAGIVSLVARSVEGLKTENVTIMDSTGRLVSDPHAGERDELPAPQLEYRRELERYLSTKAEEMLGRHLGAGKAIVRISADINFQKMKERRETYSPDGRVAAAERLTTSKSTSASARGVAGAASNVARAGTNLSGSSSSGGGGNSEETISTDYLVSRTVSDVEDRMGAVTRLTISALTDLSPSETGASISAEDAQEIIKLAVGFKTGRDEIKLTNVRLIVPPVPPEGEDDIAKLGKIQAYVSLARNLSLALAVVLGLAIIPLALFRRRAKTAKPEVPPAVPPTPEQRRQAQIDRLTESIRTNPDQFAKVFGALIGQGAR